MFSQLRIGIRHLARTPGFSATIIVVLALGIGATAAIFSVVQAVLLNPFPYRDGNHLIFVGSSRSEDPGSQMPVAYLDYLEWRRQSQTTEQLAYASGSSVTLTGTKEPAVLRNAAVSAETWPLLGMEPALGRVFTGPEDRVEAPPVCVLSHATWQKHFAGDPQVLGRNIILDSKPYTIIGVMPPAFKFWAGDVWTPVGLQADSDVMRSRLLRLDAWVVTRPKPGRSIDDVRTELTLFARQLANQFPESNKGVGVFLRYLSESVSGQFRDPLLILLSAVGLVLLIACANVANLLLARTSARQREFAVRAALGASRMQLLRQTLIESLPLAVLGGVAGVAIAAWGLDAILAILPQDAVPAEAQIRINGTVLVFSAVLTLGTLVLFSLFPALEGSRAALTPSLQEGARGSAGRTSTRVRSALILGEVALSLVLLVAAGMLLRNLSQLQSVDVGFQRDHLLMATLQLPEARYRGSEQATSLFETAIDRLATVPGVSAAAAATSVPFSNVNGLPLVVEGRTYKDIQDLEGLVVSMVTKDYFRAQGLRLLNGRLFTELDRAGTEPVIILNEAAVKKFLPEGNPLGKRVMLGAPDHLIKPGMLPPGLDHFQWATVVGVIKNARYFGLAADAPPAAYIPVRQAWDYPPMRRAMVLLLRTEGQPTDMVPILRSVLKSLDPDLPPGQITTADALIHSSLQDRRFNTVLLGLFAATALVLSAVGIYGVVAWNVSQRTREIGVRIALGADRTTVLRLVISQSMRIVGLGLLAGVVASFAVGRLHERLLGGVSGFDPLVLGFVVALLGGVALLACWLPARRATRVDPAVALRAD
jgi:putative ABC transport system permease protein